MNNNLIGVVIDPGHGGSDPGASGNNQFEKDYTLKISNYMYNRLKELGIPVAITREKDTTLSPTDRVKKILSSFGDNPNVIKVKLTGIDGTIKIRGLRKDLLFQHMDADTEFVDFKMYCTLCANQRKKITIQT